MTRNHQDGLARYVGQFPQYRGWIFRCKTSYVVRGQPAWTVDPPAPHPYEAGGTVHGIADIALEPLGDPGPDDVDEMVKLLGAPEERTPVLIGMGGEA
jgi:hypothetical protein